MTSIFFTRTWGKRSHVKAYMCLRPWRVARTQADGGVWHPLRLLFVYHSLNRATNHLWDWISQNIFTRTWAPLLTTVNPYRLRTASWEWVSQHDVRRERAGLPSNFLGQSNCPFHLIVDLLPPMACHMSPCDCMVGARHAHPAKQIAWPYASCAQGNSYHTEIDLDKLNF